MFRARRACAKVAMAARPQVQTAKQLRRSFASAASDVSVSNVEQHNDYVRVFFRGNAGSTAPKHADFHNFWLRHNSDLDRHPLTNERIVCSSELPFDLRPKKLRIANGDLEIDFGDRKDGKVSKYTASWLATHAYSADQEAPVPPPSDVASISVDYSSLKEPLEVAALRHVSKSGAIVIRKFGLDTEAMISCFGRAGYSVIPTHFGRIEDLRTDNTTNKNTDQLGYTDASVQLHTDQPFLERPPKFQMLHCQRPAASGGISFCVDGLAAAKYLRSTDRQAFDLLSTVPITFHRKQKAFEAKLACPIFDFNAPGGFRIRYSYFTMAPHSRPFNEMEAFYRAYNKFATLVRDERHQYRFLLEAGDALLYSNWRMLHARTLFSGARWLRGVYFDHPQS